MPLRSFGSLTFLFVPLCFTPPGGTCDKGNQRGRHHGERAESWLLHVMCQLLLGCPTKKHDKLSYLQWIMTAVSGEGYRWLGGMLGKKCENPKNRGNAGQLLIHPACSMLWRRAFPSVKAGLIFMAFWMDSMAGFFSFFAA